MNRLINILIALDQLINAIFNGWPDETLSSRAHRWRRDGKRPWIADAIDALFFDSRHCHDSYLSERTGRQLPPELRP